MGLRERMHGAVGVPAVAEVRGTGSLESAFPVGDLAAGAVAVFADAAVALLEAIGTDPPGASADPSRASADPPRGTVDGALAEAWFAQALRPVGWTLPSPWDPIAGDYRAADGWIRLHTNAPRHRAAALRVLGVEPERATVGGAVERWPADDLESAVVEAGGCAATMREAAAWATHRQGAAVAAEPLVAVERTDATGTASAWRPTAHRPLAGLRVLDLTRVLAGPVATRALAGLGATVLRVDPPDWDEPALVPEMTLGKRTARLDARTADGRARLHDLLAGADVLVHGYRADALETLGLGAEQCRRIRPGLVDVALTAYGWSGPWAGRRGFDSLVQMSSGIAAAGMRWADADRPVPLPVQALDHATGWLMGAAVLAALRDRLRDGRGTAARLSLARTGLELQRTAAEVGGPATADAGAGRSSGTAAGRGAQPSASIGTPWGPAELLEAPFVLADVPFRFDAGPAPLGADTAEWPATPPGR